MIKTRKFHVFIDTIGVLILLAGLFLMFYDAIPMICTMAIAMAGYFILPLNEKLNPYWDAK